MTQIERGPGAGREDGSVLRVDFVAHRQPRASAGATWAGANWSSPVAVGRNGRVRLHPQRDVWMVEPDGPLDELADDLDHSVQCALAEFPRAVVCNVPGQLSRLSWATLDTLAAVGRHAQVWPETPVVMVSRDPRADDLVGRRKNGRHLHFASSLLSAWTHVMFQRPWFEARMSLAASPTAPRAARRFLAQACEEWQVRACTALGELVVSELATNALRHTGTDLEVLLASDGEGVLRVGVRDRVGVPPSTRTVPADSLGGRGLHIVETVSRCAGALPTADGGKVVWATVTPGDSLS